MKKVRCDYEVEPYGAVKNPRWQVVLYHEDFEVELTDGFASKKEALLALLEVATKLNIELGEEIT